MAMNDPTSGDGWLAAQTPEVQTAIKELRRENAGHRAKNKTLEQQLAGGDATTLTTLQAQNKDLRTRLALMPVAQRKGVDPEIAGYLLKDRLATFDPDQEDAADLLDDWLGGLLEQKPELKKVNPPTRSGGDNFNPSGGTGQLSRTDLATMRPEDVIAAMRAGKLDSVLGRRR